MSCCGQCQGIEDVYNDKTAKRDLKRYHKKGPNKTTEIVLKVLAKLGVQDLSLIDIGGGVGVIQQEL
ncbi:MAG: SAM-dependent methyltransferase, partial [Chloroflexota bacterium]